MNCLKCPVCNQELFRVDNSYKCNNNHSYDISRYGHTNLLLANQHHSLNPGDSKEMILARVRFFKNDKYKALKETLYKTIEKLSSSDVSFLDIACGEGYYTNYIHENLLKNHNVSTCGVDISKYGVIECAKKANESHLSNLEYFVGNLFNLPFLDNSFDILLNCFAPIDENEFARVLKENGYYIRVLPDTYHLYELKNVLYENVILNEGKDPNLVNFNLVDTIHVNDTITLENEEQILDLFMMTPYYYKSSLSSIDKLKKLKELKTRISFTILIYKKKD